jgi:hypothetical protein
MRRDVARSKLSLRIESNRGGAGMSNVDAGSALISPVEPRFRWLRSAIEAFVPPATAARPWSFTERVAFRFLFLYLLLSFFPSPLDHIPGIDFVFRPYAKLVEAVGRWVGAHVWKLGPMATEQTGSGDTAEQWVLASVFVSAAIAGTVVWSIAARGERDHARLHAATRVWVRYLLGLVLFSYGMAKVYKSQFPAPDTDALLETYGESTPMHLLWTFMGASTAYSVFGGVMETAGALLLFWRRTATLGALVVAGVMLNVVMLNFCYDVPVKLYSSQLLVMAIFVAAPDMPRLAKLLVLGRGVDALPPGGELRARWAARTKLGVKVACLRSSGSCPGRAKGGRRGATE